jgi:putative transcriptional regulator
MPGLSKKSWKGRLTFFASRAMFHVWKANFPYTEECEAVKNKLEQLRKARGIRQEELAEALEVSRQTIGSLENGRYNPSILLAFKIARYFGLSIEEIFIYEEDAQ